MLVINKIRFDGRITVYLEAFTNTNHLLLLNSFQIKLLSDWMINNSFILFMIFPIIRCFTEIVYQIKSVLMLSC